MKLATCSRQRPLLNLGMFVSSVSLVNTHYYSNIQVREALYLCVDCIVCFILRGNDLELRRTEIVLYTDQKHFSL